MKIALIGDIHFSLRNGHPIFQENLKKFFDTVFFPTIDSIGVDVVLQTGDAFDGRKSNNTDAIKMAKECFYTPLNDRKIDYHQIIGNHDAYHKESLRVNSPSIYLKEYDNVYLYTEPKTLTFDDVTIDMIPWICEENRESITSHMILSQSDIAFGHFEINGFEMTKGHYCEHGISTDTFKKYKHVWSGHFHKSMNIGNIKYLGSPSQHNWDDVDEPRGFYIYDTELDTITFYTNPNNLFVKIHYTDESEIKNTPDIEGRYVKIIADNVTDRKRFEKFIDELYLFSPIDIKTVDKVDEVDGIDVSLDDLESGTFDVVKFLIEYSMNNHIDLTDEEKLLLAEQYKTIFALANVDEG